MKSFTLHLMLLMLLPLWVFSESHQDVLREEYSDFYVEVDHFEKAEEYIQFLRSNGITANLYSPMDEKYVSNPDSGKAIWIGPEVPLSVVKTAVSKAFELFPFLCYVSIVGDKDESAPESVYGEIFIGGATSTALEEGLTELSHKELLNALNRAETIGDFHTFIRSKYGVEVVE